MLTCNQWHKSVYAVFSGKLNFFKIKNTVFKYTMYNKIRLPSTVFNLLHCRVCLGSMLSTRFSANVSGNGFYVVRSWYDSCLKNKNLFLPTLYLYDSSYPFIWDWRRWKTNPSWWCRFHVFIPCMSGFCVPGRCLHGVKLCEKLLLLSARKWFGPR